MHIRRADLVGAHQVIFGRRCLRILAQVQALLPDLIQPHQEHHEKCYDICVAARIRAHVVRCGTNCRCKLGSYSNELKITSGQCSADELIGSAPRPDEMVNCRRVVTNPMVCPVNGINRKDIENLRNQSKELNDTKNDYKTNTAINDAKDTMEYLDDFLYENFDKFLVRMNKPALKAAGSRGGITETLNTIVNTLNDLVTDFMGSGLLQ